jgi:hypothetical protein
VSSGVVPLLLGMRAKLWPIASSCDDGEPYGSRIDKLSSVSWLNSKAFLFFQASSDEIGLIRVLLKRNLEVFFLENFFE